MLVSKKYKVITESGQIFEFQNSVDALRKQKRLREFKQEESILKVEITVKKRK